MFNALAPDGLTFVLIGSCMFIAWTRATGGKGAGSVSAVLVSDCVCLVRSDLVLIIGRDYPPDLAIARSEEAKFHAVVFDIGGRGQGPNLVLK